MTSRMLAAAAGSLLVAAAGIAPAQAPSPGEAAVAEQGGAAAEAGLSELIRSLDSEQWAERQQAEDALREALADLATLEEALSEIEHELSPEARRRLTQLGEEVFLRSPRPGVGISFSRDAASDGVRIDSTVRGFDADEHLKRGDIIVSFGGIPTPDDEQMRTAIMVHDPEDVVEVTVRRDNEIVPVQLRLGWFRDLNPASARQPDQAAMRRAWAMRAAGHLEAEDPDDLTAEVDLQQAVWQGADVVTNQARAQLQQQRRPTAVLVPEVTVAGSPAAEDRLAVDAHSAMARADQRREQFLRQIDARVASLTERIDALQGQRQLLDGENPEAAEQMDQELERLRALRQELLTLRDLDNVRP